LAVADGLQDLKNVSFVLFESGTELGGLARTVRWDPYGDHDLGPHKLFSLDRCLLERVKRLLPRDQWLERPKRSSIWMNGHFLPYPPSPFSLLRVFGPQAFGRMLLHYGLARARGLLPSLTKPATFEDDLRQRVGSALFVVLFAPIAQKLWGDPERLDVKLSKGRVQTPKILEVIQSVLGLRRESEFEAMAFSYPAGGLQHLWRSISERAASAGEYHLSTDVTRIELNDAGDRVKRIHTSVRSSGKEESWEVGPDDFVFSTIPLTTLLERLDGLRGDALERARRSVDLNDLILVFLKLDKRSLLGESWVFVPDPNISYHRLSEQHSFDPGMTPTGSILCAEIMSHSDRPYMRLSDSELVASASAGLETMGYKGFEIQDSKVIRLPSSYPVYRPGFERDLSAILSDLDAVQNLRSIGRQGAFNYIGTLDAMDIGYGAARWLTAPEGPDGARPDWQQERQRTSHYPVLD
jgi:protoporphyrinogen oxidase